MGRATKVCCFVGCANKNKSEGCLNGLSFSRIPPSAKIVPQQNDPIRKHQNYHKKKKYRSEFLDRCGLSRLDKSNDYRIFSAHHQYELVV